MTKGVPASGVGVGGETPPRQPARTPALRRQATAYEVDDLEAVTVFQLGLGPGIARSDVAVQLYGYAVWLHAEGFDEGGEGERGVEGFFVPVDVEFHPIPWPPLSPLQSWLIISRYPRLTAWAANLPPLRGWSTDWGNSRSKLMRRL